VTNAETIDHLNGLIEACKDGESGYRQAAEAVRNTELETIFNDYSKQRAEFARQLQAEVERLGGSPGDSGSVGGAVFRGWMGIKSALTSGDGTAILASCETGEDSAEATFEKVVNMDISGHPKVLVEAQWKKIKEAHARVLRLKEEMSGAHFQKND
jgi:uncharacterized protein (TIGR02284 family)